MKNDIAQVTSRFVKREIAKQDEILREATALLVEELVKAMPYETGNLSRSIKVSLDGVVPMDRDPKAKYVDPSSENAATLLNAEVGKPVYISITAPYAKAVNYGRTGGSGGEHYNIGGSFFVLVAANKWPVIVRQAVANVQARSQ
jgi:hypothetical protein